MRAKLQELRNEIRRRRHLTLFEEGKWLRDVVRGYFAYHGVPTNIDRLDAFRTQVARHWYRAIRADEAWNAEIGPLDAEVGWERGDHHARGVVRPRPAAQSSARESMNPYPEGMAAIPPCDAAVGDDTSVDAGGHVSYAVVMAVSPALLKQLLMLGEPERVEIAHALLASVDEKDELSDADRAKLHAAIEQSLAEVDAGQTVPFGDVIASLRAKRLARAAR